MKTLFRGLGVALVTPFLQNKEVDYDAIPSLVNHVVEGGAHYLVVLGTTGEYPTLSAEEKQKVVSAIVDANQKRVPLVLGLGGNNTQQVLASMEESDLSPFKGIMSASPYYNKPSQEGLYQHFLALAEKSPLPILLYNIPGRTGVNILPDTVLKIAKAAKNVVGIKEACGDFFQAQELLSKCPPDFIVTSGDDTLAVPMMLAGAQGVISVAGNAFPKLVSEMTHFALNEEVKKAYALQFDLLRICDLLFEEGNPAGVKAFLKEKSLCAVDVRLPLVNTTKTLQEKIHNAPFLGKYS